MSWALRYKTVTSCLLAFGWLLGSKLASIPTTTPFSRSAAAELLTRTLQTASTCLCQQYISPGWQAPPSTAASRLTFSSDQGRFLLPSRQSFQLDQAYPPIQLSQPCQGPFCPTQRFFVAPPAGVESSYRSYPASTW